MGRDLLRRVFGRLAALVLLGCAPLAAAPGQSDDPFEAPALEQGFEPLFDGESLDGWFTPGRETPGYRVEEGLLVCPRDGGGLLFTRDEYSDFVLRFEFRLQPGGNNGVAVRAPLEGNPAYEGMEIQILDDGAPQYASLQPWQYHGSIYGVVPARRGALAPPGNWNREEILCRGGRVRVTLNDTVIVDADLAEVEDPELLAAHPGLRRARGYIGFMGHGHRVEFRRVRIKDLSLNVPPEGFEPLFNGSDLAGWKGLVANPPARAAMEPGELARRQAEADEAMRRHWSVAKGVLRFDGKGHNLCTARDYADFELLIDWKIPPGGDSGVYLRGAPQVQIWDNSVGSGGLYNNQKHPSRPAVRADRPCGVWNRFRVVMRGERVTVWLNGELVVNDVVMENYWERDKPIYPSGAIELQSHGGPLFFRNLFIREIAPHDATGGARSDPSGTGAGAAGAQPPGGGL